MISYTTAPYMPSSPQDIVKMCTAIDPLQRPDMRGVLERLRATGWLPGGSPASPSTPMVSHA